MQIRARAHIWNIHNIDTVKQTFDCRVWLQFRWIVQKPWSEMNASKEWTPIVTFIDHVGEKVYDDISTYFEYKDAVSSYMFVRHLFYGTFSNHFDLRDFPFDSQTLKIPLVFFKCPIIKNGVICENSVYFDPGDDCMIFNEAFVQNDIWELDNKVFIRNSVTKAERNGNRDQHAILYIEISIKRKSTYYIYNIVLPIFIISGMSLSVYILPKDKYDIANIVLTLLLVIIGLKLSMSNYIPATNYLTQIDKYILANILFIAWVYISIIIQNYRNILGYMSLGMWILIHILFLGKKMKFPQGIK